MTTSGVYSLSVSRDDIIRQAMLNVGKLDPYETPTAQQTTDFSLVLNMMVKQWQGKADFAPGLKMWTRKHGHLFLSGTTGQYTVGPGATGWTLSYKSTTTTGTVAAAGTSIPLTSVTGVTVGDNIGIELDSGTLYWTTISSFSTLNAIIPAPGLPSQSSSGSVVFTYTNAATQPIVLETATLRDIYNEDTPLRIMNVQDYDFLPSKTDPLNISDPTAIYYEFQLGNSILYTDIAAAQDVTKHICLTYQEAIQDFVNPLDTPYFPQEWFLPLCWGLSELIAPQLNAMFTPAMEKILINSLTIAKNKDPETCSLFFNPGIM